MKKILFLFVLIIASVQTYADTRAQALLLHNGQGKSFDADQLQQAVNEAVASDTIYLSEGTFDSNEALSIGKKITILGAGDACRIRGNVNIVVEDATVIGCLTISGIHITGDLFVEKDFRGLIISKCWIGGQFYALGNLYDARLDRCYINHFRPSKYTKSVLCFSCIIYEIWDVLSAGTGTSSKGTEITFMNCNIGKIDSSYLMQDVTFINCISMYSFTSSYLKFNTHIYSLYAGTPTSNNGDVVQNCYGDSKLTVTRTNNDNFPLFNLNNIAITPELLIEKGYVGNDGTAVGAYGGTTPYSLTPDGISIKESVLRVDPETRKLNVTLKVATE